jgi:hypothetical protein
LLSHSSLIGKALQLLKALAQYPNIIWQIPIKFNSHHWGILNQVRKEREEKFRALILSFKQTTNIQETQ